MSTYDKYYTVNGGGFQVRNGTRHHNRPLYGIDHMSMTLTGDRPALMLNMCIHGGKQGNLYLGIATPGGDKWFHDFDEVTATYIPGMMKYELGDKLLPDAEMRMEVVSISDTRGFIVKISGSNLPADSKLIWMFGGASGYGVMVNALWQEEYLRFEPSDCVDNKIDLKEGYFWMQGRHTDPIDRPDAIIDPAPGKKTILGGTSFAGEYKVCEAVEVASGPAALFGRRMPYSHVTTNIPSVVVFGTDLLPDSFEGYVAIFLSDESDALRQDSYGLSGASPSRRTTNRETLHMEGERPREPVRQAIAQQSAESRLKEILADPASVFTDSLRHWRGVAHKIEVETPDSLLNKVVESMCVAQDACWYPPSFMHGTRSWQTHYLGWRIYYGANVCGWHDRVKTAIRAHCAHQIQDGPEKGGIPATLNTDDCSYNMNECFVDQVLHYYDWTGDKDLMREIFPVLKGVLIDWQKRVLDPDNDGLYTNSLNTWISDYHWYYGAGCTQSSAYTWRANAMMAHIAEDIGEDPRPFQEEAAKIKDAVFKTLWLTDKGHFAECIDTQGLKRIHDEAELPTIYHPIEFYMTDDFQAYQTLRWAETSLEEIKCKLPDLDACLLWSSNWWPADPDGYNHSSRDPGTAESLNTALAYYRIGSAQRAYRLVMGAGSTCLLSHCPGGINYKPVGEGYETGVPESMHGDGSHRGEGADFGETVAMFLRVTVEGLFGISPGMQNEQVTITPAFPPHWDHASLKTKDIELAYQREASDIFEISTVFPNKKELKIIARKTSIKNVQMNGQAAYYELVPGIGHALICIQVPAETKTSIAITYGDTDYEEIGCRPIAAIGEVYRVTTRNSRIVEVSDPQGLLADSSLNDNELSAAIVAKPGAHTFFVLLEDRDVKYWKPIDIEIRNAIEVVEQAFDASSRTCAYGLRNNLDCDLNLTVSCSFLDNKKQEDVRLAAGATEAFAWRIKDIVAISPGTNVLSVVTEGDRAADIAVAIKCWAILESLPAQADNVEACCHTVSLNGLYNEDLADVFKQEYVSPRPGFRNRMDHIRSNGLSQWNAADITPDDSMMRAKIVNGKLLTDAGIPFEQVAEGKNAAFVSIWDNFPDKIRVPVNKKARKAYLLISGTTFPMQSRIANGRVIAHYSDGKEEQIDLVNPDNYDDGLADFGYNHYANNASEPLGQHTHADLLDIVLDPDRALEYIELEALSNQVVIGLLGITLLV